MRHADEALQDQRLLEIVQAAWNKHCRKSKTRGRPGAPAEVILRLLLLKHIRDWSYEELTREVRANGLPVSSVCGLSGIPAFHRRAADPQLTGPAETTAGKPCAVSSGPLAW